MSQPAKRRVAPESEPVRVLGRGLRAARGVRLGLRTVRDATGKTQVEVAQESQMNQADVSRLETRTEFDDCQIATLRRYVSALGGQLELVARFRDKRIILVGAQPAVTRTVPASQVPRGPGRKRTRC